MRSLMSLLTGGTVRRRKLGEFEARGPHVARPEAGEIERLFFAHDGPIVHKWHHYLPVYDRHLAPLRDAARHRTIRVLEIGVSKGGSLQLWRRYFGPEAIIFGVDIDRNCEQLEGLTGCSIRIGSQDDPAFLAAVAKEMGGEIDLVLDDGSHMARHINRSFEILFPLLADQGLYVVEDLQCSYWRKFGGGYRGRDSFIETAKRMIDDMHHWWHDGPTKVPVAFNQVAAMHVYNSIFVLEKSRSLARPQHSKQGNRIAPDQVGKI